MTYTRTIALDLPVSHAVDRIKGALKEHAFGTLTEIDLQATMKEKLDVDIEPYMILGACHPELARRALEADRRIGALLPCNVRRTIVDALDPSVISQLAEGLDDIADDASQRIQAALDGLASRS
jgi:uncharacterized protein (DUF302 family)